MLRIVSLEMTSFGLIQQSVRLYLYAGYVLAGPCIDADGVAYLNKRRNLHDESGL